MIAGYLLVLVGVGTLLRAAAPSVTDALFGNPFLGELVGFLLITLPVLLYFALTESSPAQATLGKRRMGVRVVGTDGGRIGLGRSLARSAIKFLPWELAHAMIWQFSAAGSNPPAILDAGLVVVWVLVGVYLVSALLDARRRTLYDRVAGTLVVRVAQPATR